MPVPRAKAVLKSKRLRMAIIDTHDPREWRIASSLDDIPLDLAKVTVAALAIPETRRAF